MAVWFPFAEFWWFYLGFTAVVLLLLALDLGVFHRTPHAVSMRESVVWSTIWVALALGFNYGFYLYAVARFGASEGTRLGLEFLAGYVVEKALAVDNIFVFVMVFGYFGIPPRYQHRVLFYGILGALAFRALFIALGAVLLQYQWVVVFFGGLLILTGLKMLAVPDRETTPDRNPLVRLVRRWLPVTPDLHADRFLVTLDGRRHATPLLIALLVLEMSDVIFAIDSVPAIFALTSEPLIVYTSNVFAILGLRAMYFLLAGAVQRFALLKYALAGILVFVGLKMVWLNDAFGGKFPIEWSLAVIAALLAAAIAASLVREWRGGTAPASPRP